MKLCGHYLRETKTTPIYNTRLTAFCPGLYQVSWYQNGKTNPYLLEQERVAVASTGPYAKLHLTLDRKPLQHLTTQFYRPDALPAAHPTTSWH